MLFRRLPVPIERERHVSFFSMLEMDEGDAEENGTGAEDTPSAESSPDGHAMYDSRRCSGLT
jgi:hypothetical protein